MRILIVGSINTVFVHSYAYLFHDAGHSVAVLDTSPKLIRTDLRHLVPVFELFKPSQRDSSELGMIERFKRRLKALNLDRNLLVISMVEIFETLRSPSTRQRLFVSETLTSFKPDLIFFFWGTTLRTTRRAIADYYRTGNISTPITVLDINTYPTRSRVKLSQSNWLALFDRSYFSWFDKVICSSQIMARYIVQNRLADLTQIGIFPDRLSRRYFPNTCSPSLTEKKTGHDIIFLGNCDFSGRTIDDVSETLRGIAASGVRIWLQSSIDSESIHENVRTFPPFSYDEMAKGLLGSFVQQFDAAIVVYADLANARGAISYPTRLALAITGFVPILLRRGQYLAIEEIFRNNSDALLLYDNTDEIVHILHSHNTAEKKKRLISARQENCADSYINDLISFFSKENS